MGLIPKIKPFIPTKTLVTVTHCTLYKRPKTHGKGVSNFREKQENIL